MGATEVGTQFFHPKTTMQRLPPQPLFSCLLFQAGAKEGHALLFSSKPRNQGALWETWRGGPNSQTPPSALACPKAQCPQLVCLSLPSSLAGLLRPPTPQPREAVWGGHGWWVKSREAGTSPELCLQHRGKGPHRQPPWDRILQIHQPWTWGLHGSGHSLGPQAAHQSSWWWLAVGEKPGAPRQSSSWLRSGLSHVARAVAWQGTWWLSGHSCAARGPKSQATLSPAVAVDTRVTGVL